MKILILHHHFNLPATGGALRSYYLAQALVSRGVEVTVVTRHNEPTWQDTTIEGIHIQYFPIAYRNEFRFYRRIRSFLQYVFAIARHSRRWKGHDRCYAISTPLTIGVAALWLKWTHGIPYYFEVGDLWPDAPIQLGYIKNPILRWALFRFERWVYNQSLGIVVLSPDQLAIVRQRAKPDKRVALVPNMADTDFFQPEEKDPVLEARFGTAGKFVISYVGAIGRANGLDFFLQCAKACEEASMDVKFILCGEGAELPRLRQAATNIQLGNLNIIPFQNRDGVREVLNVTDACMICYLDVPVLSTGAPNKYFDALAAGKMIITNFGGWIGKEIEETGCGFSVADRDKASLPSELKTHMGKKVRANQQAARRLAEVTYSRTRLGTAFFDWITRT